MVLRKGEELRAGKIDVAEDRAASIALSTMVVRTKGRVGDVNRRGCLGQRKHAGTRDWSVRGLCAC